MTTPPESIPIDYIKTAFERLGLNDNFRLLLLLYGFTTLEDFESLDSTLLEDLEHQVSTNSLAAADFSSKSDQKKYLGHELKLGLSERPYKIAPLIKAKLLEKLPPIIKTLTKEKFDFEVFKNNITRSGTHSSLNNSQTNSQYSNTDSESLTQWSTTCGSSSQLSTNNVNSQVNVELNSNDGSSPPASRQSNCDHDYAGNFLETDKAVQNEDDNTLSSGPSTSVHASSSR